MPVVRERSVQFFLQDACMPSDSQPDSLTELTAAIRDFAEQRDWEQFHSPKNIAMALIVETAELVEHFQWLSQQESRELDEEQQEAVALEMADVLIYLMRMADRLGINLLQAAQKKLGINEKKYPVALCAGKADKYTCQAPTDCIPVF